MLIESITEGLILNLKKLSLYPIYVLLKVLIIISKRGQEIRNMMYHLKYRHKRNGKTQARSGNT